MKKILLVLAAFTAVFIGFTGCPNAAQNRPDPVPQVKEHTVAFNAADENGELIAKSDGKIITSSAKIAEGKIVTFTAKPKTGYVADTWTIEGASFESGTGAPNSDSASVKVSADTTVKVSFKAAASGRHAVSFASFGSGTLTVKIQGGDAIVSGNEVENGKTVEFLAVPDAHWKVKSYALRDTATGDLLTFKSGGHTTETSVAAPAQAVIGKPVTIEVVFDEITHDLSLTAVLGNGTFTVMSEGEDITSAGKAAENKTIEITAKPNEGYSVDKWTITGGEVEGGTIADGSPTARVKVGTSAIKAAVTFKWTKDDGSFIPNKTYKGKTKLSCLMPRMKRDFGAPLLEDAYVTVDESGNATLVAKFRKASLTIMKDKESNIFIDPRNSQPGYYDMNGVKQNVINYTISPENDTATPPGTDPAHTTGVRYVTSMTFPVSKAASVYYLWIYINSDVYGVQFCDGKNPAAGHSWFEPGFATEYKAEFSIDWASFKPE